MEPIREGLFEVNEDGSGYLLTNQCERCGVSFFPRRKVCNKCLNDDKLMDTKLSKNGVLHTYTVVYQSLPYFNTPYIIGYIDYQDECIRVFSQLVGCKPEEMQIGMQMELIFAEMDVNDDDKKRLTYKFRPAKDPS